MQLPLLVALALLAGIAYRHRQLVRALGPVAEPKPLAAHPSLSVIRPIKGVDAGLRENLRSAFRVTWPSAVEILFVLDDEDEPALPSVREAIEEEGRATGLRAEIVFCGPPPPGRTGKLHAMIAGVARARGEVLAFVDSDVRTDPAVMGDLVATLLADDEVGSAFAPIVVSEPPRTLGDAVYALLLNALYTPDATRVARRNHGELPFILGQCMAIRREAVEAIGGLEAAQGQIVDDLYIGQLLRRAGLRNRMGTRPVRIVQFGLGPGEALRTYARWITFSRRGLPDWRFKAPIALRVAWFWVGLLGAAWAVAQGGVVLAAGFASVAIALVASLARLQHHVTGRPLAWRHKPAPAVLCALAPVVVARIYLQRSLGWRGRTYRLDPRARLAERS
ncbi:MAG: glycosyltransferase [Myxococcota bacterium]|nr:glycosyltransferase [Myxococcota bacterium]